MNVYSVPPSRETIDTLRAIEGGVRRVGIVKGHAAHPGCAACLVETVDGSIVHLSPSQHDLEFKFEVFPLEAKIAESEGDIEWGGINLIAPVTVSLLQTEEWLDPSVPCGKTVGENPIMQCQGVPGSAPNSATAVCRYVGGVSLLGKDGVSLFIATASFPYTLHVQGIAEDDRVSYSSYRPLA